MTLEDIIRYENEGTALDFKAKQYGKEKHADLIKDIMAMANADVQGERHIIVGIKCSPSGKKSTLGISEADFVDDATYQQVIRENIEPDILFSYAPLSFENAMIGVFTIGLCNDAPYLMRKDYQKLRRGEGWIRKGTHQVQLTRDDYDRIYQKALNSTVGRKTRIGFGEGVLSEVAIPEVAITLPSYEAEQKILSVLAERKRGGNRPLAFMLPNGVLGPSPYEQRSVEVLRENLGHVSETYSDDDWYTLQEAAVPLRIFAANGEDEYIRNATIVLEIPAVKGILPVRRLVPEPQHNFLAVRFPRSYPGCDEYPSVKDAEGAFVIEKKVGDIVNHLEQELLAVPPRLILGPGSSGQTVDITYRLHAENLRTPITGTIKLKIGKVGWRVPEGWSGKPDNVEPSAPV